MMIRNIMAGVLALIACAAGPAHAASHATAPGVAAATVVSPLRVIAVAPMDFGQITHVDGVTGTVTVSPGASGAQFAGGASAACAGSACTDAHAARFAVSGEPQRNYTIQLPATIVATGTALSGAGVGVPALTVNGLTVRSANSASAPRLDAAGTDKFEVGGTIALPADLPPAHYRASFTVIVSYI
jgi:hypothetical protein